jgi:hypothetical protein
MHRGLASGQPTTTTTNTRSMAHARVNTAPVHLHHLTLLYRSQSTSMMRVTSVAQRHPRPVLNGPRGRCHRLPMCGGLSLCLSFGAAEDHDADDDMVYCSATGPQILIFGAAGGHGNDRPRIHHNLCGAIPILHGNWTVGGSDDDDDTRISRPVHTHLLCLGIRAPLIQIMALTVRIT